MGYTHYWDLKGKITPETKKQMKIAVWELNLLIDRLPKTTDTAGGYYADEPLKICSGDGTGKPIITDTAINFNGCAKDGNDYESFYFNLEDTEWSFCKTARKPYDFVVCLALICLANNIDGFKFSSDGGLDDWKPAIDFYFEKTGREVTENLKDSMLSVFGVYDNTELHRN